MMTKSQIDSKIKAYEFGIQCLLVTKSKHIKTLQLEVDKLKKQLKNGEYDDNSAERL